MEYKLLSDPQMQPTLSEMTAKALEILKKNKNGFVLLVEGGRIDTAHHKTKARLALDEAKEFQNAVEVVREQTNEQDTLIVVTADHSTVLTVGGYMVRHSKRSYTFKTQIISASRIQHFGTRSVF
jgi:alkaline phosphatase